MSLAVDGCPPPPEVYSAHHTGKPKFLPEFDLNQPRVIAPAFSLSSSWLDILGL